MQVTICFVVSPKIKPNVDLYVVGRGYQTRYDCFKPWAGNKEKRSLQYTVEPPAGVYSFVCALHDQQRTHTRSSWKRLKIQIFFKEP